MKKLLTRRRLLLGGAGAVVALPVFESLIGERAAYADDAYPARTLLYYVPNGIVMNAWTPPETGANFTLPTILAPLVNVQSQINVLTGLSNTPAKPDGPGDHAGGTSGFLTCAHANKSETEIQLGISMDQVIANTVGDATILPSLQMGIDGGGSTGGCDSGYSCAYTRNISWASTTQPLSKTTSPLVVFNQIFQGVDPSASAEEQARRLYYRLSVLDYVREEANALQPKLGATDKAKLDEYLTGVFELEQKLNKPGPSCTPIAEPTDNYGFEQHVDVMADLMILALTCDATRVISFMLGNAGSNRTYSFLGVSAGHHQVSHHQNAPQNIADLTVIDTWEVQQFATLLERMDATIEGSGTLLQHSQVLFSAEIEDGDAHRHRNLPVVVAGGCHGAYTTGRHIVYEPNAQTDGPPIANLFITMMQSMGLTDTTFGDTGTGPLGQLA
jgi:hypothetical protein